MSNWRYVTEASSIVGHGGLVMIGAHVDPIFVPICVVMSNVTVLVHAHRADNLVVHVGKKTSFGLQTSRWAGGVS